MTNDDLKPCRACKEDTGKTVSAQFVPSYRPKAWCVRCTLCQAVTLDYYSMEEAAEVWNDIYSVCFIPQV